MTLITLITVLFFLICLDIIFSILNPIKEQLPNKIQKFISKRIYRLLFLILIITIVGIPLFMNWALSWNITTHNSSDGDWLGFWGSFLGSIIGGIATLVGVLYTINQEKKSKIQDQIPRLIPADVIYKLLTPSTDSLEKSYIFTSYGKEINKNTFDQNINIKIINASQGHAFNLKLEFITPSFEYFKDTHNLQKDTIDSYSIMNYCNKTYKITQIPVVTSSSYGNITDIPLSGNFQAFFTSIFNSIIKKNNCKNIYIGKIKLIYDDLLITKETIKKTFDMYIYNEGTSNIILKTPTVTFNTSYVINLKFKSID